VTTLWVQMSPDQVRALNFQTYVDEARVALRDGRVHTARGWIERAREMADDVDDNAHREQLRKELEPLAREARRAGNG
jgi:hypothetical protein